DPDLPWIAELQKGLVRIIRGNQAEEKSLLRIASIEEITHPQARGPGAAPVADTQVFQTVGARGLRIARVVIEAAERGGIQARKPAARIVILGGRGEFVAGRKRLFPPV